MGFSLFNFKKKTGLGIFKKNSNLAFGIFPEKSSNPNMILDILVVGEKPGLQFPNLHKGVFMVKTKEKFGKNFGAKNSNAGFGISCFKKVKDFGN